MSTIGTLVTIADDATLVSDDINQNFADTKASVNTCVFTDVTNRITSAQLFANNVNLSWRNAADSGDLQVLVVNASNLLEIGGGAPIGVIAFNSTLSVALGGGAAATLGTVGGSGPATAGQNAWLRVLIGGNARWLPYWA